MFCNIPKTHVFNSSKINAHYKDVVDLSISLQIFNNSILKQCSHWIFQNLNQQTNKQTTFFFNKKITKTCDSHCTHFHFQVMCVFCYFQCWPLNIFQFKIMIIIITTISKLWIATSFFSFLFFSFQKHLNHNSEDFKTMKSSCISFMSPCSRYSNKKIKPQPTKCTAFTNTKVHFLRRTSTCTWILWGTEGGRKCQEWRLRRVTNHLKNQGAPPCKTLNSLGRASHCASPNQSYEIWPTMDPRTTWNATTHLSCSLFE